MRDLHVSADDDAWSHACESFNMISAATGSASKTRGTGVHRQGHMTDGADVSGFKSQDAHRHGIRSCETRGGEPPLGAHTYQRSGTLERHRRYGAERSAEVPSSSWSRRWHPATSSAAPHGRTRHVPRAPVEAGLVRATAGGRGHRHRRSAKGSGESSKADGRKSDARPAAVNCAEPVDGELPVPKVERQERPGIFVARAMEDDEAYYGVFGEAYGGYDAPGLVQRVAFLKAKREGLSYELREFSHAFLGVRGRAPTAEEIGGESCHRELGFELRKACAVLRAAQKKLKEAEAADRASASDKAAAAASRRHVDQVGRALLEKQAAAAAAQVRYRPSTSGLSRSRLFPRSVARTRPRCSG